MRTIGLLGGIGWESTATYYRVINQLTRTHRGRLHSAPLLIWGADFEAIRALQLAAQWNKAAAMLASAAGALERADTVVPRQPARRGTRSPQVRCHASQAQATDFVEQIAKAVEDWLSLVRRRAGRADHE